MDVHVYLHLADDPKVDQVLTLLSALAAQVGTMNAAIQQVKDDVAAVKTQVTGITSVAQAAVTAFQGLSAIIAGLKQQIADLIANGTGLTAEDKQALQDVHDGLGQVVSETGADAKTISDAIVANTPS